MSKLTYEIIENYQDGKVNYPSIGKVMKISNGIYEVIVTLEVGPRLMHFSLCGKKNMLNDDCSLIEHMPDGRTWYSYGGHRIWHAPEKFPRSYVIDSDPLEKYEITENGICLYQKEEPWTQIQKIMELEFKDDRLVVYNRLVNKGAWAVEMAVWGQTSFSKDCLLVCPVTQRYTGLLPNTFYVIWPYARMNDPRPYFGQRFVTVNTDSTNPEPFKFGYPDEMGWAAIINHDQCMIKAYTHDRKGTYPDMGCSFESYTQDWGGEFEDLAPLKLVQPGKTYEHKNEWFIFGDVKRPNPKNEDEVAAVMAPMLEKAGLELPVVSGQGWDPYFEEDDE